MREERASDRPGIVAAINVSGGGVPKLPRPYALVDATGLDGDRQRNLRHHGGPDRAVCLYSLDLIHDLQAEGHPIAPGTIGENLTLAGVPWLSMKPGTRVEIGEVVLELTSFANPCRNIAASFSGGLIARVSESRNPGWSRLYARVLDGGMIAVGDPVTIG